MATKTLVSEREYLDLVQQTPDAILELYDGEVREKPGMSWNHGFVNMEIAYLLRHQLNRDEFEVRLNEGRLRRSAERYYVPDIAVIPASMGDPFRDNPDVVAILDNPLPLVVEVWSRSTGDYDVDSKIPEYKARGDLEIWRVHPYERTLTAWVRQPDSSYHETVYREGVVMPVALPGVAIELAAIFGR